jgi:hypothetical protein
MGTIGIDFDGVIRKWPTFIQAYADFISPNDILERAGLKVLKKILSKVFMTYTPLILDGKMITSLQHSNWNIVVISGRYKRKEQDEVVRILQPYLRAHYLFRGSKKEREEEFKLKWCKTLNVSFFIDDRKYIVEYLRRHGVQAYHVKEIRKCSVNNRRELSIWAVSPEQGGIN